MCAHSIRLDALNAPFSEVRNSYNTKVRDMLYVLHKSCTCTLFKRTASSGKVHGCYTFSHIFDDRPIRAISSTFKNILCHENCLIFVALTGIRDKGILLAAN